MIKPSHKLPAVSGMLFALLLGACASLSTQSSPSSEDSRYVKTTGASGFYLLRSTSPMVDKLGFSGAPVTGAAEALHPGRGTDVIAFRFDGRGVLAAAPAYIYQSEPESYYSDRLKSLSVGRSTLADVKELYPSANFQQANGGVVYLLFRVRNAAERF